MVGSVALAVQCVEDSRLNSPFAILRAEDKPRQLSEALKVGFAIPDLLVSNDFDRAQAFVARGGAIGKPLRHALVERGPLLAKYCSPAASLP